MCEFVYLCYFTEVVQSETLLQLAKMLRVLSLLLVVQLCVAQQLEWPKQYTAKGQIILPYGDIVEPFTAYVDMSGKGRSRIDYYGGNLSCS